MPIEVRLGRTDRPYRVDQDGVRGRIRPFRRRLPRRARPGRTVLARAGGRRSRGSPGWATTASAPSWSEDLVLATLNVNLGLGLRWQSPGSPLRAGPGRPPRMARPPQRGRPIPCPAGAWSLRFGAGAAVRPRGPSGGFPLKQICCPADSCPVRTKPARAAARAGVRACRPSTGSPASCCPCRTCRSAPSSGGSWACPSPWPCCWSAW